MTIWFDMDGTIADLYGVENWLSYLMDGNTLPYEVARPLVRLSALARILNNLQRKGYQIGIISWLSKSGNADYNERVTIAKMKWIKKHLASVKFDEIHIVEYGTYKETFAKSDQDILFDDELNNRKYWTGKAFDETEIFEILKSLA